MQRCSRRQCARDQCQARNDGVIENSARLDCSWHFLIPFHASRCQQKLGQQILELWQPCWTCPSAPLHEGEEEFVYQDCAIVPIPLLFAWSQVHPDEKVLTCVVAGDVDMVGEDTGKHGAEEEGGNYHEADDGHFVTSSESHADQTQRRNDGS